MPAGDTMTTNLDFMLNVESNLTELGRMFQAVGGQIRSQLSIIEDSTKKWGVSLGDVLSIQLASGIQGLTVEVKKLVSIFQQVHGVTADALTTAIDKTDELSEKTVEMADQQMKDAEERAEVLQKEIKMEEVRRDIAEDFNKAQEDSRKTLGPFGDLVDKVGLTVNKVFGTQQEVLKEGARAADLAQTALTNMEHESENVFKRLQKRLKSAGEEGGTLGLAIRGLGTAFKIAGRSAVIMGRTMASSFKAAHKMAKVMWTAIMGPLAPVIKLMKWFVGILGGLSFVTAIQGAMDLDAAVNDIARTMTGGVESAEAFRKTSNRLMTDIKNSAMEAGAAVQDMAAVYQGLAAMHIPVEDLKGLADLSWEAAKGLGMSFEQTSQLVGTLQHVGRLSQTEIRGMLNQFASLQQTLGLSAAETQALAQNITESTRRLKSMGATQRQIQQYSRETTRLAATFIQVGLEADAAAAKVKDLFDPESLEQNIALYSQLGMSVTDATAIMQGAGEIPEDMAAKFVSLSKRIVAMGPIAGRAYAKTMNMSYGMAQQLASLTADQAGEVNKLMGRAGEAQEDVLAKQRERQQKQLKEQFEQAKNRMALLFMETLQPILEVIREIMVHVNKLLKDMAPYVKELAVYIGQAMQSVSKIIPPIFEMIKRLTDLFFAGAEESIFSKIVKIVEQIVDMAMGFMPIVEQILTTLIDAFMTVVPPILSAVMKIIEALSPAISAVLSFVSRIITPIAELFTDLIDELIPVIAPLGKVLAQIFKTFGKIISNMLAQLKGPLTKIIKAVVNIINAILPAIMRIIKALEPIFDVIAKIAAKIGDIIGELLFELAPAFEMAANIVAMVFEMLGPILEALIDALIPALDAMMPLFDLGIKMAEMLMHVFGPLIKYALNLVVIIVRIISAAIEGIAKVMERAFGWISDIIDKLPKREKAAAKAAAKASEERKGFLADLLKGLDWSFDVEGAAAEGYGYEPPGLDLPDQGDRPWKAGETRVKATDYAAQVEKQTMTAESAKQIEQETAEKMVSRMDRNAKLTEQSTEAMRVAANLMADIAQDTSRMVIVLENNLPELVKRS